MSTWNEIFDEITEWRKMSSKPSEMLEHYDANFVFDQDKTVRWNREEGKRRSAQYVEELHRLKDAKDDKQFEIIDHVLDKLSGDYGIPKSAAQVVLDYNSEGTDFETSIRWTRYFGEEFVGPFMDEVRKGC